MSRPRIGNGTRRGLVQLAQAGLRELEELDLAPQERRSLGDRRELARAIAWASWYAGHDQSGNELKVTPRARRRRRHREPLEQLELEARPG